MLRKLYFIDVKTEGGAERYFHG